MSNLSEGQLHCSPIRVKCTLTLEEIRDGLAGRKYSGDVPATGWGSIEDDTDSLHTTTAQRPIVGTPQVLPGTDLLRPRLKARYYWDAADPRVARILGGSGDPRRLHTLNAVDLVLAHAEDGDEYEGIITTRTERDISFYVEDGIRDSFVELESSSFVQLNVLDAAFESDFFLWLLYKYDGDQRLTSDLNLEVIRTMKAQDFLSRGTSLTAGAEMDRAELAAAVTGHPNQFGPAQFAVYDSTLDLSVEIELHPDGTFRIIVGGSDYDEVLQRSQKGPRLADDTAFVVLPKLRRAFIEDGSWPAPGLGQLRARARQVLEDHLAQ